MLEVANFHGLRSDVLREAHASGCAVAPQRCTMMATKPTGGLGLKRDVVDFVARCLICQ